MLNCVMLFRVAEHTKKPSLQIKPLRFVFNEHCADAEYFTMQAFEKFVMLLAREEEILNQDIYELLIGKKLVSTENLESPDHISKVMLRRFHKNFGSRPQQAMHSFFQGFVVREDVVGNGVNNARLNFQNWKENAQYDQTPLRNFIDFDRASSSPYNRAMLLMETLDMGLRVRKLCQEMRLSAINGAHEKYDFEQMQLIGGRYVEVVKAIGKELLKMDKDAIKALQNIPLNVEEAELDISQREKLNDFIEDNLVKLKGFQAKPRPLLPKYNPHLAPMPM